MLEHSKKVTVIRIGCAWVRFNNVNQDAKVIKVIDTVLTLSSLKVLGKVFIAHYPSVFRHEDVGYCNIDFTCQPGVSDMPYGWAVTYRKAKQDIGIEDNQHKGLKGKRFFPRLFAAANHLLHQCFITDSLSIQQRLIAFSLCT